MSTPAPSRPMPSAKLRAAIAEVMVGFSVGLKTGGEVKRSNLLEGAEWMGDLGGETLWGEGC